MRILIFILLVVSLKCYAPVMENVNVREIYRQEQIKSFDKKEFSKENFITLVNLIDSINAKPIIQQAILETGWFRSGSFRNHNNLFGMKFAKRHTISGEALGHASFSHWTNSVKDYFIWREYITKKRKLHIKDYYVFLNTVGYAEGKNYTKVLKTIKI